MEWGGGGGRRERVDVGNGVVLPGSQENWPEVYHKAVHMTVTRTTWYCKYDPDPVLRDAPPSDDPRYRLLLSDDLQRMLWNSLLPEGAFVSERAELVAQIKAENGKRWEAYGPGGKRGLDKAEGVEAYKKVRFVGYLKDCDAPQYDEHMKEVDRAKQRLKRQRRAGSKTESSAWTSWAAPEAPSGWEIH